MSTFTRCDGCKKKLPTQVVAATPDPAVYGNTSLLFVANLKFHDLCESCLRRWKELVDVSNWG